jgi:FMN phosphatase YigB (HAD superfamily)
MSSTSARKPTPDGAAPAATRVPGVSSDQVVYPALEEVARRLRSGAIEALTSDVFDTIVWRTVPEPVDVFVLLGQRLREREALDPSLDPRSFALLREHAEVAARLELSARAGSPEVCLEEIWSRIPEWAHRPLSRAEAMAQEVEVEREALVPDLDVIDLMRVASKAGVPVYAVSDTYFSPDQIASLFEQPFLGDLELADIFTSSDRRTSKSDELFDHVLAAIGSAPELVAHLGDNDESDVAAARQRGMTVAHVPRRSQGVERLLRRESAYRRVRALAPASSEEAGRADLAQLDGSLVQLRAKMALHREAHEQPEALRPMWHFGAEVLGPPLAGFADWAVEQAQQLGVSRLHCLMREGDFLSELVADAAAAAGCELETTKLYLNRQVVTAAAIGEASREEIERLIARRETVTVRQMLEMLGVEPALCPSLAGHLDSPLDEPHRRNDTFDALAADEFVRQQIQAHSADLRERIVRLVRRQHGDLDEPFVLVDLGWGATIQRRLAQLLRQSGIDLRVDGLYLVTHEGAVETVTLGGRVAGFLASFGHPKTIADSVIRSPEVLEQVCMPDQGTQLDLNEELEPVLADVSLPESQRVEAAVVRDGIRAFQRSYLRYRAALPAKVRSLGAAADQLSPIVARACVDPTVEEAARFGSWQHDAGQGADQVEHLANDRLVEYVRSLDPEQMRDVPMEDVYWPSAVARLHDPHLADLVAAQAAGLLDPEAGATAVETGEMAIEASAGIALDPSSAVELTPRRNHNGLSYMRASLRGAHIERVQIRLGSRPAIVRVDRLELRLHVKDMVETPVVRLDQPEQAGLLSMENAVRLSNRVVASLADHAFLNFDTGSVAPLRTVHRVDVELSFLALGWDAQSSSRAALGSPPAERQLEVMRASASWRLTRPLRAIAEWLKRAR